MRSARVLCVPNFSEGRNPETIQAIADAVREAGVLIHHLSWDYDHHRMVLAFSGTPAQVKRAVLRAGAEAIARIDLRVHQGVHPRIGAVDVVPFVPLSGLTLEQAVAFSHQVARAFARRLGVPVYMYEYSAGEGRIRDLPTLRRGQFEGWVGRPLEGVRRPDYGPAQLHPTAGATVMGVRDPLIAFNVNLATQDVNLAKAIARRIREERDHNPDLFGVRALGLWLPTRQLVQVSLNLTRTARTLAPGETGTSLVRVLRYVQAQAESLGTQIHSTELIGVILAEDAIQALRDALQNADLQVAQLVASGIL